ncbi:endo-1,4-beta-xylanase [Phycicoccus flavus]|uniref:endo-1,4-beta-xylanase n=1 Tax=Phycicoccus flavus TaxID=2502783 RepID=UPI000FEBB4A9|nr:endo-1,4-beta-xylanase [Phycicoccus flavus]NHA66467.1 endo-1,4-beta-xylanase [Phycicoccus flavus]
MSRTRTRAASALGGLALAAVTALVATSSPAVARRPPSDPSTQTLATLADRHHLAVGTAIDVGALSDPTYRSIASTEFSTVTPENVMKWEALEPTRGRYDWSAADRFMRFAEANDQQVRGHVLVWSNQLPGWLTEGVADGSIDRTELRALLRKHVTDVVTRYKGRIWQWDVVNEAVEDGFDPGPDGVVGYKGFWYDNLGPGYVADAFRWARAADPKALLFYNDYNIDAFADGGSLDKTQFVYDMVRDLKARGVPVDGVGSQAHLSTRYPNYSSFQIADALNRFAGLGVATALTEVDVRNLLPEERTGDTINPLLQAQAFNYGALMQGCLASRKCISYTVWGFDDGHSWTNDWDFGGGVGTEALAAIYDEDYRPKPAYAQLQADLAYAGPPMVLPRIPQKPAR